MSADTSFCVACQQTHRSAWHVSRHIVLPWHVGRHIVLPWVSRHIVLCGISADISFCHGSADTSFCHGSADTSFCVACQQTHRSVMGQQTYRSAVACQQTHRSAVPFWICRQEQSHTPTWNKFLYTQRHHLFPTSLILLSECIPNCIYNADHFAVQVCVSLTSRRPRLSLCCNVSL